MNYSKKNIRTFFYILLSVVLYRCTLKFCYITIIYPTYNYQYFVQSYTNKYTILKDLIAWFTLVPIPFIVCKNLKKNTFSDQISTMIICLSYIPASVLFVYTDIKYYIWYLIYFIIFFIALYLIPPIRIKMSCKITKLLLMITGLFLGFSVIFIWVFYSHFHIQTDIMKVSEIRAEAALYDIPTILSYSYAMAKNVIPVFIVYNLYNKRYLQVGLYTCVQLINFCIDGTKGTFFILIISYLSYFLVDRFNKYEKHLPILLMLIGIIGLFENKIINTINVLSLIYRRMLFLPVIINNFYYDFFSHNEFDYFRQSLEILGESPYGGRIAHVIGDTYMSLGTNANNGLFSDAYMNLGYLGVFIFPVLWVIVLKLFDGATKKLPIKMYATSAVTVTLLILSSTFFSNMLTHGIALMFIVTYLMSADHERATLEKRLHNRLDGIGCVK